MQWKRFPVSKIGNYTILRLFYYIITVRSALHPGYKAFLSNRQKEMDKSYSDAAYEMDEPDSEMGTSFDSEDSDSELLGSE